LRGDTKPSQFDYVQNVPDSVKVAAKTVTELAVAKKLKLQSGTGLARAFDSLNSLAGRAVSAIDNFFKDSTGLLAKAEQMLRPAVSTLSKTAVSRDLSSVIPQAEFKLPQEEQRQDNTPGREPGESLQNYILRTEVRKPTDPKKPLREQLKEGALRALVSASYANQLDSPTLAGYGGPGKGFDKIDSAARAEIKSLTNLDMPGGSGISVTPASDSTLRALGVQSPIGRGLQNPVGTLSSVGRGLQSPIGAAAQSLVPQQEQRRAADARIQQQQQQLTGRVTVGTIQISVNGAGSPEEVAQAVFERIDREFGQALSSAVV
jgi:hypothetical protein